MGFCCNGFGWGSWMGWGGRWIGPLLGVALFAGVLVLLGLATVWIVRQFRHTTATAETFSNTSANDVTPDALEIARRRLAAGEITVAEFGEIRDQLQS